MHGLGLRPLRGSGLRAMWLKVGVDWKESHARHGV